MAIAAVILRVLEGPFLGRLHTLIIVSPSSPMIHCRTLLPYPIIGSSTPQRQGIETNILFTIFTSHSDYLTAEVDPDIPAITRRDGCCERVPAGLCHKVIGVGH